MTRQLGYISMSSPQRTSGVSWHSTLSISDPALCCFHQLRVLKWLTRAFPEAGEQDWWVYILVESLVLGGAQNVFCLCKTLSERQRKRRSWNTVVYMIRENTSLFLSCWWAFLVHLWAFWSTVAQGSFMNCSEFVTQLNAGRSVEVSRSTAASTFSL